MSKTLRLGFIMGGGVSLGTFSGAALSEAIKQQIVYGQYDTEQIDANGNKIFAPYSKIEIDVFSGASAGAISLAIMLRMLINPRDKFQFLGFRTYEDLRAVLEQKVLTQFEEAATQLKVNFPEKYEQLLAAQTIQEFQEKVWGKEVDIERFLGTGAFAKDLSEMPSFLDRSVVDKLGVELFQFQTSGNRLEHKIMLGDRVLFGCTLANLSYTLQKPTRTQLEETSKPSLIQALNDSSIDKIHSELRVFDLNFKKIESNKSRYYPLKWVQYHLGEDTIIEQEDELGSTYKKNVQGIHKNDVWREISATAIASAAVPFAFEPVVLNRYKYEYGSLWASELQHKSSYPFTYVDGGVFNNEPVKEAMRLASYIDTTHEDKNFERQLIFVDPDVNDLENQFKIHAHEKLSIGRSIFSSKTKVSIKPTILRIIGGMTHLMSAVLNEAQSIEVGKIADILEQFKHREQMRAFYRSTIKGVPAAAVIKAMIDFVQVELEQVRQKLNLPSNTLQIQHEFIRIVKEEKAFLEAHLPLDDERKLLDSINEFIHVADSNLVANAEYWVFVLSCLTLDISMNLVGKTAHTKLIPIAPFNFYNDSTELKLMSLPGKGMAGFTGFASHEASAYEIEYGKYCARRILQELELTSSNNQKLVCPPAFDYKKFDTQLKNAVRESIVKRLKEMVPSGFSTIMPFLEGYLNESIQGFVDNNINGNSKTSLFEFRIQVPSELYVLRGFNDNGTNNSKKSLQPVSLQGNYYLISKINFDFQDDQWKGTYTNFMQNIYIDKSKFFEDMPALSIELPVMSSNAEAYLSPNPVFVIDARLGLNTAGYTELSSRNWELKSDILPLDEHLWGEDKWL